MYLRELLLMFRRRWYLVAVALVFSAVGSAAAFSAVPPDYEQQGSVVLIPPKSPTDPEANRFLEPE